ncbi:hypothetical protein LSH36_25g10122 [Paralvinella palmiformis]|uniref:MICOS complex subunit MIC13 n=1 Tax=Paralvinella palmiformis TaxID=53620 RepID=A0AAD9KAC6_9ANNE|nr:hypothetical protein LSH36_25g10122 [Paralvinella palmiformis]
MVLRLTWKLAQVAAGTAFVAVSVHYGVWGTTYNGSKVVERVRTKILPTANEYLVQLNLIIDHIDQSGVQTIFHGMLTAPDVICDYSQKAFTQVQSYING